MEGKKKYNIEKEGQQDFFDNFHIDYQGDASVLVDNTDGVYHGNILEFKLNISNTGKVLLQAIKYLSKMRIKGESVPARILLIDLNATKVYVYHSADYIDDIQKVYVGAASRGNDAFTKNVSPVAVYDYSEMTGASAVQKMLKNKEGWYIPIDIDENCIVGWAERYYRELPTASKGDFLGDGKGRLNLKGEIRDPKHFAGLINPYTEETNEKFKYLMDCLNDRLSKKDLGAFYTPEPYCQKAAELVEKAVARVPEGNDYIILDRCAGTGNLEAALYGRYDRNGDELISHCVVSTYEYYEYKVLLERIGQDVRDIIPPTEANVVYENGKISNADAMSREYIENPLIKQYLDNPKCTIILFENPPYRDTSSSDKSAKGTANKSYIFSEMQKHLSEFSNTNVSTARDLANQFIWSGFEYYLRQPTDSYVLFSPIKYWKTLGLSDYKMIDAYLFNRAFFHATASGIGCILWANEPDVVESFDLKVFDINESKALVFVKNLTVKKSHSTFEKVYDRRKFANETPNGLYCLGDGTEAVGKKCDGVSYLSNDIIAFAHINGYNLAPQNKYFTRLPLYDNRGTVVRKDVYLNYLPLWCAKMFPQEDWFDKDVFTTSYDCGDAYTKDKDFLKSCLIYTCLSNQNKCLSFTGSDGRCYRNELCLDTTNGDTVASSDLKNMTLDEDEKKLMFLWESILSEAKKTASYYSALTYGVYQIARELNTAHKEGTGTSERIVYDYPELNCYLISLRDNLKLYYKSHITAKMFKYELLK